MAVSSTLRFNPTQKVAKPRVAVTVAEGFEKRLVAYAMAAGAGLLVSSQPATAAIVWTEVSTPIPVGSTIGLDLDGGGDDFTISNSVTTWSGSSFGPYANLRMNGVGSNEIDDGPGYPFSESQTVGTANSFWSTAVLVSAWASTNGLRNFVDVTGAFIALKFDIGGSDHYGFARFDVTTTLGSPTLITATLTGYGYNDVAGADAHIETEAVPEPGTLGLLALGAAGLLAWRRKTQKA